MNRSILTNLKFVVFFPIIVLIVLQSDGFAKIYKYKNKDGTIVYTDTPSEQTGKAEQIDNTHAGEKASTDISEQLNSKLKPKTIIEKAALCVVTIKSSLGHGSGFFITDDGYILTNKHVIRVPEEEEKRRKTIHANATSKIKSYQKQLNEEKKRLDNYKKRVDEYKKYLESIDNQKEKRFVQTDYQAALKQYQSWLKEYNRREHTFKKQVKSYEGQKNADDLNLSLANLDQHFTIYLSDNSKHHVYLVAISQAQDLALLKLNGYKTPFLTPANRALLNKGQPVYAIGNPATLKNSVSKGIISGWENDFIKTDAKIYPGNSGGPLVTETGNVAGINTFKKLTHKFEGLGFALPVDLALKAFKSYLR